MGELDGVTLITEPAAAQLNERQQLDYELERENCLSWLLTFGKQPAHADGYAFETVRARAYRMDQFYRWVWDHEDRYTTDVTHEHADAWMRDLARQDTTNAHKANCQKAVRMLLKWRQHEHGLDSWEPAIRFSESSSASQPRDYLTIEERRKLRDAALEYGSIPAYSDLSPQQRDRWKTYLAQRFEKPKEEVTPSDWERANGWKIPSLTWVSLDAGLRPIEVTRATTDWVDIDNNVLRIPAQDSSKNHENWIVSLQQRTARILDHWLSERDTYEKYEGTDALWLTREGNPYTSQALSHVLEQLCDIAEIATQNRKMSWYAIRHSVGTYMTREEDLAAAQTQLRHTSEQTTMKYDQTPVEDRRDALDRMG